MNLIKNITEDLEKKSQKLAIYTVLTGTKEPLGNPLSDLWSNPTSDLEIEYYCITDNPALTSDTWQFILMDKHLVLPPEKLSRHPKCLPHLYFPEHEFSLFIDNIVKFKRLPQSADLNPTVNNPAHLFKVYAHFHRTSIVEEALAIAGLKYDSAEVLAKQLGFYEQQMPLEDITPLTTGTVLLRQHHQKQVKAHGELWWLQILQFSKRDQMSFDFAVKQVGVQLSYFEGIKNDNQFIHKPNSMSGRVRASFDVEKYKWIHRQDPAALQDPKAHFLSAGAFSHERYEAKDQDFEMMCYLAKSSLGKLHSPRREMAAYVQNVFERHKNEQGGALFACFPAGTPKLLQYDECECRPIMQSLFSLARRYGIQGEIDMRMQRVETVNFAHPLALDKNYRIMVFLGVPSHAVLHLYSFVSQAFHKDTKHSLLIHFDRTIDIMVLAWIKKQFEEHFELLCFETMASSHDELNGAVPQSVLFIELQKKPLFP